MPTVSYEPKALTTCQATSRHCGLEAGMELTGQNQGLGQGSVSNEQMTTRSLMNTGSQ